MEEKVSQPTKDGQQPISVTKVVSDVLTQHTKKPKFLTSGTNLEAQLATEKKGNAELRKIVNTFTKKVEESEEARIRQEEEYMKKQALMDSKLDLLLSQR
ncbi:hypothetical protein VPH35_096154 [Triticum aestivum]